MTGTLTTPTLITGAYGGSGSAGDGFRLNSTDLYGQIDASDKIRLNVNGDSFLNGGNVGIGTTTPDYALHIKGAGHQRIKVEKTDAGGDADISIANRSDGTGWVLFTDAQAGANSGVIKYVHNGDYMSFRTNGTDDRMRIDSSGRVGIGTDSPSAEVPLTVYYSNTSQFHIGGAQAGISNNVYYNGSAYVNRNTGAGGTLFQMGTAGEFAFRRASSGSSPTLSYSMYIDGSGNVGIGTTTPAKLGITGSSAGKVLELSGDDSQVRIGNSILHHDNSANTYFHIRNHYGATSSAAELSLESGYITFNTGTSFTERMRVKADGNIEVGTSSNGGALSIIGAGTQNAPGDGKLYVEKNNNADWSIKAVAGADDYGIYTKGNGNYGLAVYSHNSSAYTFRVNYNGDILAVNTTVGSISDRRLKENIVDANSQWDDIKALKWKNYSWKESSGHNDGNTYLGLIADEVKAISPNLVAIEPQSKEDIEAGIANPEYENVKYSVVWLKAMKALQEAMTKIETLETKLEAAEARIETLEG